MLGKRCGLRALTMVVGVFAFSALPRGGGGVGDGDEDGDRA